MQAKDLPQTSVVRASTRENALTAERLERDYGIAAASVAEGLRSHLRGWVCCHSEAIVGFAIGDVANGEVIVVAVLPDYEGTGIGRELLSRVQAWLFSTGHAGIWLLANPDPKTRAHGFYRKLGWKATGAMQGEDEVLTLERSSG
jgi:GNAT superfamily N-acetyltransferase